MWYFIDVRHYFDIETLCERIEGFDYGPGERGNKPPTSHLIYERLRTSGMKMSASETLCLARYLGEMIGDLVPEGNGVWDFYLLVRGIAEILTCPFIENGVDKYLEIVVKEHHEMYLKYFGSLQPKHHFSVHYSMLLKLLGPLVLLSALMCERFHRRGTMYARTSNSRVDLAFSVAIKYQLYLCERLMRSKILDL